MRILFGLSLLLVALACQTRPTRSVEAIESPYLFPRGTYIQEVGVQHPGQSSPIEFNGVLILQESKTTLKGLSPLGTTLFQIRDSDTASPMEESVKLDVYMPRMQNLEQGFAGFYRGLRPLLSAKNQEFPKAWVTSRKDEKGRPTQIEATGEDQWPTVIRIDEFEPTAGYPKTFVIQTPQWSATIKNKEFRE